MYSYEKVNKYHPDKVADRIAGALVDLSYQKQTNPKVAIEVLIGHGKAFIINETSAPLSLDEVKSVVYRICESEIEVEYREVAQDVELAKNQEQELKCGDNGIFKGVPTNSTEYTLAALVQIFDKKFGSDGKYILSDTDELIICQSKAAEKEIKEILAPKYSKTVINPLGEWTGGINVDSGATNRKLGSDMGRAVTGGGINGKDLSKADVTLNIVCHIVANQNNKDAYAKCAIGDSMVDIYSGKKKYTYNYSECVELARTYISKIGGFEKLAEYGLIR